MSKISDQKIRAAQSQAALVRSALIIRAKKTGKNQAEDLGHGWTLEALSPGPGRCKLTQVRDPLGHVHEYWTFANL